MPQYELMKDNRKLNLRVIALCPGRNAPVIDFAGYPANLKAVYRLSGYFLRYRWHYFEKIPLHTLYELVFFCSNKQLQTIAHFLFQLKKVLFSVCKDLAT